MTPYITFRDKDSNGNLQYYVLQRNFPHFIGVVLAMPEAGNWCAPITGHSLWVVFSGTLRGNTIPSYKNISEEIQNELENMAIWFHSERIVMNEKRFKKFKIISNDSIAI